MQTGINRNKNIGSGFNQVSESESGIGIQNQNPPLDPGGQKWPTKI